MAVRGQTRNMVGAAGISAPTPTVAGLWLLVILELAGIAMLRRYYRKHHGG